MEKLKIISKVFYWSVFIILIVIAGIVIFSTVENPSNLKLFVVQSGSMEPTIKTGSIVLVKPEPNYSKGDVITFRDPTKPNITITHRIFDVGTKDGQNYFITKGDANNAEDMNPVNINLVLGKVTNALPYLGYPVDFAKTQTGFMLLIVIPGTLIIYSELINIKNETKKLLEERRRRKLKPGEQVEVAIGEGEIKVGKEVGGLLRRFKKS